MSEKSTLRREAIDELNELIHRIQVGMFSTLTTEGIHSRPMLTAKTEFDGYLWFFTAPDDPKVSEIRENPQVNISYSSPNQRIYASLSGPAELVQDARKTEALWQPEFEQWFPEGPDSGVSLIKVSVQRAEFWDDRQNKFKRIVAYLLGGNTPAEKHGEISWEK